MMDREELGRKVREIWVSWARVQPAPKPSWLVPYDQLTDADQEADRMIGEEVAMVARDEGVDFVLDALAKALGLERWTNQDGSETWDGDVRATLYGILSDAGVWDDETGAIASHHEHASTDERPVLVGYGKDEGKLVRVEVLDGTERIDFFRPNAAAILSPNKANFT